MDVKRKPNETVGSMLRRFSRLVQQSRFVPKVKASKHFKKKASERQDKNRETDKHQSMTQVNQSQIRRKSGE